MYGLSIEVWENLELDTLLQIEWMKMNNSKLDDKNFFEDLKSKQYPVDLIDIVSMMWKERYDLS